MLTDASGVTTVTLVSSVEADGTSYVLGGAGGPSDGLGTGIGSVSSGNGYDIFGGKSIAALSKEINGASAPSLHDLEVSLQPGQNSNTVIPSQGDQIFDMNNPILAAGGDGNGLSTAKTVIDAMEPALSTQEYLIGLAAKSAPAIDNLRVVQGIKGFGLITSVASLGITAIDIKQNGLNVDNGTDAFVGGVSFIPGGGWIISPLFSIDKWMTNLILQNAARQSNIIDSPIPEIENKQNQPNRL